MYARAANTHASKRTLIVCLLTSQAILAGLLAPAPQSAGAAGPSLNRSERAVIRVLNRIRADHGLARLKRDRRLARAADSHSSDMLRADFFSHTSSNGTPMPTRVSRFRPSARVGETLGYVPRRKRRSAARKVVGMWMRSPGHRAAVLSRDFRRVGVGRRIGRLGRMRAAVYTADFSSRR